jgi:hypothetical protein
VQNATSEQRLQGSASLACVKPLKPATFGVLAFLWRQLRQHGTAGSAADVSELLRDAKIDSKDKNGEVQAFLGLSHGVVLERVRVLAASPSLTSSLSIARSRSHVALCF